LNCKMESIQNTRAVLIAVNGSMTEVIIRDAKHLKELIGGEVAEVDSMGSDFYFLGLKDPTDSVQPNKIFDCHLGNLVVVKKAIVACSLAEWRNLYGSNQ